jgi:tight adherence protein B
VSNLITVLGDAAIVGGFAAVGFVVAAPGPWLLRRRRQCSAFAPVTAASRGLKDALWANSALWRGAAAGVAGMVLAVGTGWPVMVPIGAAGMWFLPRLLRSDGGLGEAIAKVEAIATFTELLRDTLTAAAGLGQAIGAAATCAPAPIETESKRLAVMAQDRTVPIERALHEFADQLDDPCADLVVIALAYAARNSAGDLASLLSDLAKHARQEASLRQRILIAGSRTRTAVKLITGVTLVMGAVLYVVGGRLMTPYSSVLGQGVLLVIAGLFAAGFAWLQRLARPTVQPRLLRTTAVFTHGGPRLPAPRSAHGSRSPASTTTGRGR